LAILSFSATDNILDRPVSAILTRLVNNALSLSYN